MQVDDVMISSMRGSVSSPDETLRREMKISGAPNENVVQNYLNIALLKVF